MGFLKLASLFIATFLTQELWAAETCSRVATINYQKVLIDTNSTQKGEGLKHHLEKDKRAKYFLEEYQKGTEIKWQNAILGPIGSGAILAGFLNNDESTKKNLLISGAVLIAVNFFVARTMESANESNLYRAVEEYNKRNLPKIFLDPKENPDGSSGQDLGVYYDKRWSF